jgi:hypothetical protein
MFKRRKGVIKAAQITGPEQHFSLNSFSMGRLPKRRTISALAWVHGDGTTLTLLVKSGKRRHRPLICDLWISIHTPPLSSELSLRVSSAPAQSSEEVIANLVGF